MASATCRKKEVASSKDDDVDISDEEGPEGDQDDLDQDSLEAILQAQKTTWTEGDDKWCGYIDNRSEDDQTA